MKYFVLFLTAGVVFAFSEAFAEGQVYNTLTLSSVMGNPIELPNEPDFTDCKTLIVRGKVNIISDGDSEDFGDSIGHVILNCEDVVFEPDSVLSTWSRLTIRAVKVSGDVSIEGLRNRQGPPGLSHSVVAPSGVPGATGPSGSPGRDADVIGADATNGGAGGHGQNGTDGVTGEAGGDGGKGENNVTIAILSDQIDPDTTFNINTNGGIGGLGGNGQAGGNGGNGGTGGNGGSGGDGSCTHRPNRGGDAGNGGNGGNAGDGGDGGDGGAGGDGGDIYIVKNENDPSLFELNDSPRLTANGGKGGVAGQGGAGGKGGKGAGPGLPGPGGRKGADFLSLCDRSPAQAGRDALPGEDGKDGRNGRNGVPGPYGKDGEIRAAVLVKQPVPDFILNPLTPDAPSN